MESRSTGDFLKRTDTVHEVLIYTVQTAALYEIKVFRSLVKRRHAYLHADSMEFSAFLVLLRGNLYLYFRIAQACSKLLLFLSGVLVLKLHRFLSQKSVKLIEPFPEQFDRAAY